MPPSSSSLGPFLAWHECLFVDNTLMLRTTGRDRAGQWLFQMRLDNLDGKCTYSRQCPAYRPWMNTGCQGVSTKALSSIPSDKIPYETGNIRAKSSRRCCTLQRRSHQQSCKAITRNPIASRGYSPSLALSRSPDFSQSFPYPH